MLRKKRNAYRSIMFVFLAAAMAISCSRAIKGPQRTRENGIEVVSNGSGIYPVAGQPMSLSLHEEFRIDLEDEAMSAVGLNDAMNVDVDSRGRIYLFRRGGNPGPFVFQFDERGKFLKSFCSAGQGPDEVVYPHYLKITDSDEIPIYSQGTRDIRFFDTEGHHLRSISLPNEKGISFIQIGFRLIPNGNYLILYVPVDDQGHYSKICLGLFDGHLRRIRDIRVMDAPDRPEDIKGVLSEVALVGIAKTVFFVNTGETGTDIGVFDLNGKLLRKIRVDNPAVKMSGAQRKEFLERVPAPHSYDPFRTLIRRMETIPPFHTLLPDDQDHLFVPGFEKDEKTGDDICDMYSLDGIRIMKTGMGRRNLASWLLASAQDIGAIIKKNRCYFLREKADDYKELVVYSMIWK